jgi:hypothetical protein
MSTHARLALKEWLERQSKFPVEISYDTRIIEERIITSLQVMDLILLIETLSNRRVEIEDLAPGAFASINSIYDTFFAETR